MALLTDILSPDTTVTYVKENAEADWEVYIPTGDSDPNLALEDYYKVVEHEKPHESWDMTRWRAIEHCELQAKLRQVHRFYRMVPIDDYEPDRPTIIEE
jgi:hypothetical protein